MIDPKLLSPEELADCQRDAEHGFDLWHVETIRALLGHIAALQQRNDESEGSHCSSCGNAIDPDCCWCGTTAPNHVGEEHGFVPMGCDCGRDPSERDWKRCANGVRRLLWREKHRASELEAALSDATARLDVATAANVGDRQRIDQLEARQQELLATIVRVTNETPFPDEIKGWTEQRAKLVAEVGSARAELAERDRRISALTADVREATQTLATATQQLDQYRRDFVSMSDRAATLAGQLTAMERRYDTAMIRLRALTAASADLLACEEVDRAVDESAKLAAALEAAIDEVQT
jgi:hypothetical protein